MEDQLKIYIFISFTVSFQRNPKFPNPEQFGGVRDELKKFKFNMKVKFQTKGDWYLTEKGKFNYAFSRFKGFAQGQIFFKMNFNNVLKINTMEKFLQCLDVNFGDHNKKNGSKQNQCFETKEEIFSWIFDRIQNYINDTEYDVANQKYCFYAGMQ